MTFPPFLKFVCSCHLCFHSVAMVIRPIICTNEKLWRSSIKAVFHNLGEGGAKLRKITNFKKKLRHLLYFAPLKRDNIRFFRSNFGMGIRITKKYFNGGGGIFPVLRACFTWYLKCMSDLCLCIILLFDWLKTTSSSSYWSILLCFHLILFEQNIKH